MAATAQFLNHGRLNEDLFKSAIADNLFRTINVGLRRFRVIGFFYSSKPVETLDQINVHRINIVEPDGTLRMVISNHAQLPGIIARGKEQMFTRPQAGILFYNDEGSENGGLIFGGHRNSKGEVVDSGGSLSFDKYEANQIVQLAGVDDKIALPGLLS